MRHLILFSLIFAAGCLGNDGPTPAAWEAATTITVGQSWHHAIAAAKQAGVETHDAAQPNILPTSDGFYLEIPGPYQGSMDSALIVYRDPQHNTIASMAWVEHWKNSKEGRVYHQERSFRVPTMVQVRFGHSDRWPPS